MKRYLDLLRDVIDHGVDKTNRTGVTARSLFGRQVRFDLADGFPLLTTKRVHFKSVLYELLWFLSGSTDNRWLQQHGVTIWNEWATETGQLGPIYGHQWVHWSGQDNQPINQIAVVIEQIKTNPDSRRLIVSAWNPADLPDESFTPQQNVEQGKMALAPCHCLFQFYVANNTLSCQLYQRSADLFLGVPFNIASYALLIEMIAQQCDLKAGELIHTFGDLHLYHNHLTDQIVGEQLSRTPKALPKLAIKTRPASIFDYRYDDFELIDYQPDRGIQAPIAV